MYLQNYVTLQNGMYKMSNGYVLKKRLNGTKGSATQHRVLHIGRIKNDKK